MTIKSIAEFTILVADDDKFIRKQIEGLASKINCNFIQVTKAEYTLKTLSESRVDVLILDVYMDGMTCVEAIPKIKEINPELSIIVVTGDESIELEKQIRQLGVLGYFIKPIEIKILKEILENARDPHINNEEEIK